MQRGTEDNLVERRRFLAGVASLVGPAAIAASAPNLVAAGPAPQSPNAHSSLSLETSNGWYIQNGKAIWGYARESQMWGGYRGQPTGWWTDCALGPSIIRNAQGQVGPNRTEDLEKLMDTMVAYGCPGYEHNPPLWYDRRRDAHDVQRRSNANVVGPFFEMPWGRSNQGQAWDGLPLFDLAKFNPWYFSRVRQFADLCDRKGGILVFGFYNQHNLLETQAHYADYPWRPANCIQATDLPDKTPAANVFYDVSHPVRKELHRQYIRHSLDNLRENRNVVLLTGLEYTGPLAFMQFWLETILEWEQQSARKVHIGLGATKDVLDAVLQDPRYGPHIRTIDLRYWHYKSDDSIYAPPGGQQVPGRFVYRQSNELTPLQLYRQVKEYRQLYPEKAIIHGINVDQQQTMAFLMAGGTMLVRPLDSVREYPTQYEMPLGCESILTAYEFTRAHLAADLPRMRPLDAVAHGNGVWCLGEPGNIYLIYMLTGVPFRLDLSNAAGSFDAKWIGLKLGKIFDAFDGTIEGGKVHELRGLDWRQWMLYLRNRA
jgi:hypothetical protein